MGAGRAQAQAPWPGAQAGGQMPQVTPNLAGMMPEPSTLVQFEILRLLQGMHQQRTEFRFFLVSVRLRSGRRFEALGCKCLSGRTDGCGF